MTDDTHKNPTAAQLIERSFQLTKSRSTRCRPTLYFRSIIQTFWLLTDNLFPSETGELRLFVADAVADHRHDGRGRVPAHARRHRGRRRQRRNRRHSARCDCVLGDFVVGLCSSIFMWGLELRTKRGTLSDYKGFILDFS